MILFIDDEPRFVDGYVDELRFCGHEVHQVPGPDSALVFLETHLNEVELVILDVMMPPGRFFAASDVGNGRRTGLALFHKLRTMAPDLAVIILTNSNDAEVAASFAGQTRCRFLQKPNYLPREVEQVVREMLWPQTQ